LSSNDIIRIQQTEQVKPAGKNRTPYLDLNEIIDNPFFNLAKERTKRQGGILRSKNRISAIYRQNTEGKQKILVQDH